MCYMSSLQILVSSFTPGRKPLTSSQGALLSARPILLPELHIRQEERTRRLFTQPPQVSCRQFISLQAWRVIDKLLLSISTASLWVIRGKVLRGSGTYNVSEDQHPELPL